MPRPLPRNRARRARGADVDPSEPLSAREACPRANRRGRVKGWGNPPAPARSWKAASLGGLALATKLHDTFEISQLTNPASMTNFESFSGPMTLTRLSGVCSSASPE